MLSKNHNFPGNVQIKVKETTTEVSIEQATEFFRRWKYVNCWHANKYESAAMWKLYAKSNEAVAIKTTYQNLINCLPPAVEIGMVKYHDYDAGWSPPYGSVSFSLAMKRMSFEHEKEVRLIMDYGTPILKNGKLDFEKKNPNVGIDLKLDIRELIDKVYISPDSPSWFFDIVESVIKTYGYSESFTLHQSKLAELP
ncbi:hypothetical protein [Psychromonas aquimarina]|uniref:hypothetical protein n=1 Tax=Psychromonas aquimarina TaxID=444919 RepID=UPI0004121F57|nr:hypothetical protein [Psychromonas aquimarina]